MTGATIAALALGSGWAVTSRVLSRANINGPLLFTAAGYATRSAFRGGQVEVEVEASYVTDDLAVLAVVERQRGLVGDFAEQDWSLRVTVALRRDGGQWRLVHRHADALVHPIGWNTLSQLAPGELPD